MFVEEQRPSKDIELVLSVRWVKALTQLSILLFVVTIAFMLFHISHTLGLVFLVIGVFMLFALNKFRSSLHDIPIQVNASDR